MAGQNIRFDFNGAASESDVEQHFLAPLLSLDQFLGIPTSAIRTKHQLEPSTIDKGKYKRKYFPDHVVYADAIPILVVEAKAPDENIEEGFREAQLYALPATPGSRLICIGYQRQRTLVWALEF
jgi:hypothetical protein